MTEQKIETKLEEKKTDNLEHVKTEEHKHTKSETKTEEKQEEAKPKTPAKPTVKKDLAIVRAPSVHMSKRHGMYVCAFIKGKTIDKAIADLEQVVVLKKAVPFKGEIPHRKGKIMSGRYPVAAAKIFIPMLKNLKGAVLFNNMDITNTKISQAYANFAPRPQRRGGMKGKRTHAR